MYLREQFAAAHSETDSGRTVWREPYTTSVDACRSESMASQIQLSTHGSLDIVSFNLWDAPMVAAVRLPRMNALASFLRTRRGDVWACQELFHDDACELIGSAAKEVGLVHSVRFQAGADLPNGASGCGVVIFSRWPIVESMFHR